MQLIKAGAQPDTSDLNQAVKNGNLNVVHLLIQGGAQPIAANLTHALFNGDKDIAQTLLAMGVKPDCKHEKSVNDMLTVLEQEPVTLSVGESLTAFFVGVFTPGTAWEAERTNAFAAKADAALTKLAVTTEITAIREKIDAGIKELSNQRATPEINPELQKKVEVIGQTIQTAQENLKGAAQPEPQAQAKGQGR